MAKYFLNGPMPDISESSILPGGANRFSGLTDINGGDILKNYIFLYEHYPK